MGRACNCLLTTFRVIQFILSLAALACGAYITYTMYTISATAGDLETTIQGLQDPNNDLSQYINTTAKGDIIRVVDTTFSPFLQYLQETPTRAIVISAVGLWSVCWIVYVFFAHRSKNHPAMNRRAIRVPLELFTLCAWLACIACAVLLALQYSTTAMAGGLVVKAAIKAAKGVLEKVVKNAADKGEKSTGTDSFMDALDLMGDISTIGILAIVSVAASIICAKVAFVSSIVACCMSGKKKTKYDSESQMNEKYEHGTPMSAQPLNGSFYDKGPVTYVAESTAPWQSPYVPATPPTPYTPPTHYKSSVSYTPFKSNQYEPNHYEDSRYYAQQMR